MNWALAPFFTDDRALPLLIAEENSATRSMLREFASRWGYRTILAGNGAQVLHSLEKENGPHIAIVSNSLPDCSGIDLCRKIREKRLAYYPYILLTSRRHETKELVLASESGADDYIAKPFNRSVLKARLEVARRIHASQQRWFTAGEELRVRATHDALTGLWNRDSLEGMLTRELDRARLSNLDTGLLLLDLDRFKEVNDTHGHQAGDLVLREAVSRICHSVRSYDSVVRYGGEEFCVVMPGCSRAQVGKRAEMIRLSVANQPFRIGTATIPLTTSVGATVISPREGSIGAILLRADVALYRAKSSGRNTTVHCSRSADDFIHESDSFGLHCKKCPGPYSSICVLQRLPLDPAAAQENPESAVPCASEFPGRIPGRIPGRLHRIVG
jgi:diguanylate cyclase (GGDEF)-like protein